ncbi:F-box-like/WD repeat-containing protein TBL1Y isoform X2 [Daphnia carinata]|uniref:F-box-like/WD repeat-containing protein TBL1Y isoform X2 n=1 Tax=Daphnia carinata TaxID=120202 RepID=UPI00257DDD18|nr:F-box-like/WD repeat-containing protein TBL1Y isoform X2 [Daphnia carinata]
MAAFRHYKLACIDENPKSPKEITNCTFDTTGKKLACAFGDHRVFVFSANVESGDVIEKWERTIFRALSSLLVNKATILQVDWKADGTKLVAGDYHNLFFIFSSIDGQLLSFTEISGKLTKVQWNRKGSIHMLLTSSDDGTVGVWDSSKPTPLPIQTFSLHTCSVRDIQWLTKETFASCSMDGSIYVCRVGVDEPLNSLFNENAILAIRYNMKLDSLAFFSYETNITLWSLGQDVTREWKGHSAGIYSICWKEGEHSSLLASGADDRNVRIWNTNSSLCHSQEVLREHRSLVSAVSFSPDGQYLASADTYGVVIVWSTTDWSPLVRCQCAGNVLEINSLKWNPQSTNLVVANHSVMITIVECTSRDGSAS